MYARVRSYHINDGQVDERLKHARETSVDAYRNQKGFQGVVILVDPTEQKNMTVGFWDTEADMLASERADEATGNSAHRRYAAGDVTTEFFEVKVRVGGLGEFALVRIFQIPTGQIDERLRQHREVAYPYWSAIPGVKGCIILVDEASHKNVTVAFYESEAAMLEAEKKPESQAMFENQAHISGPNTVEHFQVAYAE